MVQKYITLNAFREEPTIIHAVQGESESRTLYIALTDSAGNPVDLTGKAVRFYAEKPDKTVIFADCTIEDTVAGKVSVALSYQTVAVKGTVNCTIYVNTSENEALKFTNLKIVVESSNVEMHVESSSEFSALVAALSTLLSFVPNTRKIAGINLQDDILLSELVAAGLAAGTGGAANNALALGGVEAANYAQVSSGTWTPTLYGLTTEGNPTYTSRQGWYYKIGSLVYMTCSVAISDKGGISGTLAIGGLPFSTAINIQGQFIPCTNVMGSTLPAGFISGIEMSAARNFGYLRVELPAGTAFFDTQNVSESFAVKALAGCYLTN